MPTRIFVSLAIAARLALALDYTYVPIAGDGNIQTQLISTIPTGIFIANNALATPFSISAAPGTCGPAGISPCNALAFGLSSGGQSVTLSVSIPNATDVYTLMNALMPPSGAQIATIKFVGSQGASLTFPLIAGQDIRDYYQGAFANTLTNGIPGVEALNALTCVDPTSCLGSGGTGNVQTGNRGTYVADEQHFSLGTTFLGQTLTQIIITDTFNGAAPVLLGATVGSLGKPTITSGGVVPIDSPVNTISSGSWISIYGSNLAAATATWNGDFPRTLAGTSVTIDNKPAYLWYVSPTQINLQVPDDSATGTITVTVTTPVGSASSTATLAAYAPSFSLFNAKYPAAIVMTPGSPGNSGAGYDIIGPTGVFPFPSRPVKPGEILILFGVGFGPTNPPVPAGQLFLGAAPSVTQPQISIGNMPASVLFAGIVEAGLFQFNVIVPNAPSGDQILTASVAGVSTPSGVYVTLQ